MAPLLSEIRLRIYHLFIETGCATSVSEIATQLGYSVAAVEAAYRQMGEEHVLILHPGTLDIWMAMPFSAVPTRYRVTVGERWWYANCAWDALGIPALQRLVGSDLFQGLIPNVSVVVTAVAFGYLLLRRFGTARAEQERLHTEMETARQVQLLMLPAQSVTIPHLRVDTVYLPAQEVGGDFFQIAQ